MWKYFTTIDWYKIVRKVSNIWNFPIFCTCADTKYREKTLKMQKNIKIFETYSHKSYEILQKIYIRHHRTSHDITSVIQKEKLKYIERSARKLHLSDVIFPPLFLSFYSFPILTSEELRLFCQPTNLVQEPFSDEYLIIHCHLSVKRRARYLIMFITSSIGVPLWFFFLYNNRKSCDVIYF